MMVASFDQNEALQINGARQRFLDRFLGELIKFGDLSTVLDVGCGYGFFSACLRSAGLQVTGCDVRARNIAEARRRYPDLPFTVVDIEDVSTRTLGSFDLVFCFGLLYHLENPFQAVRILHDLTGKYLLIESRVMPFRSPLGALCEEPPADNQSLRYVAWVPSERALITMLYAAGFDAVYRPDQVPEHQDFQGGVTRRRMRTVLLASKGGGGPVGRLGQLTFRLVPQQAGLASTDCWDTALGRVVSVFRQPKRTCLAVFDRFIRYLPRSLGVSLCKRLAAPLSLDRPRPGWSLGVGGQDKGLGLLVRQALWRWYSLSSQPGTFSLNWYGGIRMLAYPQDEACRSLFLTGSFEPNEFRYLKQVLRPGMTFVDAGAHFGLYTLFASQMVGDGGLVLAIEPSSREFERLERNLQMNAVRNVRLRRAALSDRRSQARLIVAEMPHSGHNTLGSFAYETTRPLGEEIVATVRLDEIIREEGLSRVDVIKMDLEGSEYAALEGGYQVLERFHPILLVELFDGSLQHQGRRSSEVWNVLERCGYELHHFDGRTGGLVAAVRKNWFSSENIVAIPRGEEHRSV